MKLLRDNGLTIVLLLATIGTIIGMTLTGLSVYNEELVSHNKSLIGLSQYVASGHYLSALFENWESEFLQMSAYVILTAFLFQRGSAESKDPDEPAAQDADPAKDARDPEAPLPVRIGGLSRRLYSYSLGLTLFLLFVLSFVLHLRESAAAEGAEALLHHQPTPGIIDQLGSAQFWFESFQNWQSEFLSTALVVVYRSFSGSGDRRNPSPSPLRIRRRGLDHIRCSHHPRQKAVRHGHLRAAGQELG